MATTATEVNPKKLDKVYGWSYAFTSNETGDTVELPVGDRSVQMAGTWNGATVSLQGSNDNTNWSTLTDGLGNSLALTADGIKNICEMTRYVRAKVTSGSVTTIAVTILARRGF